METKSRYEVIAELEQRKRALIVEKDSYDDSVKEQERNIKNMKRQLEDTEEDLTNFKEGIKQKKETATELITSIDESLKRFSNLSSQKK